MIDLELQAAAEGTRPCSVCLSSDGLAWPSPLPPRAELIRSVHYPPPPTPPKLFPQDVANRDRIPMQCQRVQGRRSPRACF